MNDAAQAEPSFDELIEIATERVALNRPVRRNLPGNGRLRIDRQLPFLCVYRQPPGGSDLGARELLTSEAAYLVASGEPRYHAHLLRLCDRIASTLQENFGVFLLLEVWTEKLGGDSTPFPVPRFRIVTTPDKRLPKHVKRLRASLRQIAVGAAAAEVEIVSCQEVRPPGLAPLAPAGEPGDSVRHHIGLAVDPFFRRSDSEIIYPALLRTLRRQLARALRKTFATFAHREGVKSPMHYHTYGPRSMMQADRVADQQLCEVARSFDFILQVTPVNAQAAWRDFRDSGLTRPPLFYYRPLPFDSALLKRQLFNVPIDRIEDPSVAHLFWEKQQELDRQLSALRELDSRNFLYASLQLYGKPGKSLVDLARGLLTTLPNRQSLRKKPSEQAPTLCWAQIAELAREEIERYQRIDSAFDATIEIRDDIAAEMMVSRNRLLISRSARFSRHRLQALLHHEIGTHLVTYHNGQRQSFGQLSAGLAGYEPLQEGLAVLAEHLTAGLTASRMRKLAARVVAVDSLCRGADFLETFRQLRVEYGFPPPAAFRIALRVFRGGGLTKDAVYLSGLRDLLRFLARNHELEPLYVGKIALGHLPFIQELRRREIIQPPALLPRFLEQEEVRGRLEACRKKSVEDLCEGCEK